MANKEVPEGLAILNEGIANFIKATRVESGLTQAKLARLIGVDQSHVTRLEKPGGVEYTLTNLYKIADAFNMDMEISFTEREDEE